MATEANDKFSDTEIDFTKLWLALRKGWRWILAASVMGLLIGIIYSSTKASSYRTTAMVQIEERSSSIPIEGGMGDFLQARSKLPAEIEIIKSRLVLERVVDSLNLGIRGSITLAPYIGPYLAENTDGIFYGLLTKVFDHYRRYGDELIVKVHEKANIQQSTYMSGVFLGPDLFQLTMIDGTQITHSVGEKFSLNGAVVEIGGKGFREGLKFNIGFIKSNIASNRLRSGLSIYEKGRGTGILELAYTSAFGINGAKILNEIVYHYSEQNRERQAEEAERSLNFIKEQLPDAEARLRKAETALNDFKRANDSIDLAFETSNLLGQIVAADAEIDALNIKDSELAQRYTQSHPERTAIQRQISRLLAAKKALTDKTDALPETQQQLLKLSRDAELASLAYSNFLEKSQEVALVKAATIANVRIIEEAIDQQNVSTSSSSIIMASTVLSTLLAVITLLVLAALRRGVESPTVIEQEVGLAVLATVPLSDNERNIRTKNSNSRGLLANTYPEDLAIEALRGLRTNLHFSMLDAQRSVICISGPSPEIGKSFIASNLAQVLVQNDQKVLVVDADMRKGHMHRCFGLKRENGLSDVLSSKKKWQEVVHHQVAGGLDFMATGLTPPNPSELLARENFSNLISELENEYDLIILDTPPILAVTDASIIAQESGLTVLVARYGVNPPQEIAASVKRFEQSGIKVNGCILNAVERNLGAYNYYYNYEYR